MKTGKSLADLATEIERQRTTRIDYVAPTALITMEAADGVAPTLLLKGKDTVGVNDLAHRQIGDHAGIPSRYYDRMRTEAPSLLADNVNHWLHEGEESRMVRCLDGRARAFLSDRYRPLENSDLAEAVLPILAERSDLSVVSCEITERRLYIKAVDSAVVREVQGRHIIDGRQVDFDHVSPSLTISNSEVGSGALSVERGMFKHGCRNMAIFREKSLRKYHVGARHELGDEIVAMLSEKTRQVTDAAVWAQVRDVVRGALSAEHFDRALEDVQALTSQRITGEVVKVVEFAGRALDLQEGERKSVLQHLIEGGDLTRFGLFNAVTRTAEDLVSYDRATELERIGGSIIEMAANDWERIAEAA